MAARQDGQATAGLAKAVTEGLGRSISFDMQGLGDYHLDAEQLQVLESDPPKLGILNPVCDFSTKQGRTIDEGETSELARTSSGEAPFALHTLCTRGDVKAIRALLEAHGNGALDAISDDGHTPLMYALLNGKEEAAEELIARGADPWAHLKAEQGDSPPRLMHLAAQLHGPSVMGALLAKQPEAQSVMACLDSEGCTPLHIATRLGRIEIVKAVLEAYPSIEDRKALLKVKADNGNTVMHEAAEHTQIDVLNELIAAVPSNNLAVNDTDKNLRTPLHFAASAGNLQMCEALVAAGAHLEAKDSQGVIPAVYAFNLKHDTIVKYLGEVVKGKSPPVSRTNSAT